MSPDERDEMTAAAIARLAGVSRAAVSNWRRRYPEFPKPVGDGSGSPKFSRAAVEAWLKSTGKADQLATAGQTETGTQRVHGAVQSPEGKEDELAGLVQQVPQERAITDLTAGQLLARVMVSLLPRSTASEEPVDVGNTDSHIVLDPACANGTVLTAAADRFGDHVKLVGQEIEESAASAAASSLRHSARGVPYEIQTGDSLLNNRLGAYLGAARAIVCEPPFDIPQWPSEELATDPRWRFGTPAPRDGELVWVQHCYAHLRPLGVAVIAVSPRTCIQPSGRDIRARLVRSGVLRDVIALPKAMGSLPGTDVYLWVLQRPYGSSARTAVRMIDLSGLVDAADVPCEYAAWERLYTDADPSISRAVPRLDLLDGDVDLRPSRYVAARVEAGAEDLVHMTDRLKTLYSEVGRIGMPSFPATVSPPVHAHVTIGELERVGALTIHSRDTPPRPGDLLVRTLGRPPVVATGAEEDGLGIAQVVELDADRLDAHFVAIFLQTDANSVPVTNTLGVLSRDDLRRCRIPRIPLAEQRRYGDAFRRLQELQEALSTLARVSANVIDQTIHGLTVGVLAPDQPSLKNTNALHTTEGETSKL
ncbi:SAM-dependent methyltransferase [Streptomyces sp. WAC 01529]|uniref:N-6 DNA methylase n=1 Tax=Streptomyces sp. WAC 01529 TaxID=2203205 RepID=UPI000F6C8FC2|nr:N-6 DNA methylase [Streptomyces sp. WAC 01529]AZM54562.1 SAM-dependent methyltransferase [Streptomyces sp. WAC 01529]